MQKEIRKITGDHYLAFSQLANMAFEGLNADQWLQGHIEETASEDLYGLFKNKKLVAGMRVFDFEMNFSSTPIKAGGVGMLAVDMLHKKERNAYQLIQSFFDLNKEHDVNLVMLNPFRVDFYKQMGFGMGTKTHQFYLKPEAFPSFQHKEHLVELDQQDRFLIMECYNRVYEKTHGMTKRFPHERELNRPFMFGRVIAFKQDQRVKGYLVYELIGKDLYIHEMFFESPEVIKEFSTFLHQQSDQVKKIILNANHDDLLHFVQSPESGLGTMVDAVSAVDSKHMMNTSVGIMYRIIDTKGFFTKLKNKNHAFNKGSVAIKFTIKDGFYPSNNGSITLEFVNGKISAINEGRCDAEVDIDISEFSSMVMGAVHFKTLYKWGLATISNPEYIDVVNRLFFVENEPICTKAF